MAASKSNPFYQESTLYLKYPPFDKVKNAHYAPAFENGMADHLAEIDNIANSKAAPTFENTLVAMEKSGQLLDRVATVFFALASAHTHDSLETTRSEMAPKLSAHSDKILLNEKLFRRVEALYNDRNEMGLEAEAVRLVEETYKQFVRSGAKLSAEQQERLKKINSELATHQTTFSQNVLKEVNDLAVVIDSREELMGLPDAMIEAAAKEAESREMPGKYVITLQNTSGQPPLSSLENRVLRERIHKASLSRGSRDGEFDNRETFTAVIKLRAERARLLGYENHAAYMLENQTAQTPNAVNRRLADLAPAAVRNADREAEDLQKMIDAEEDGFTLASWDWDFYSEKVRQERFEFDESQLMPYLELDNVLVKGVFYAATRLYGLTFKERSNLPVYHPDVRVFEVFDRDGSTLTLFIFDPFARSSKRGGAWMNDYVSQSHLMNRQPVVANHLNIVKPPEGEPTLLTFDEVTTAFHEFGHALHGMFSDVTYPSFSGTSVPRDFVEYPSQVNEMWADWPEILENYAVHHETGEPMPKELLEKVLAAKKFNQGFITTEYLAASLLDQSWHQLQPEDVPGTDGLLAFEAAALESAGVSLSTIPPRYRSTYFSHVMGGYSAGYYSYIWSEVLDADTVEWFKENGGLNRENGDHFRKTLLSRGGSEKAMVLFVNFRGAEPNIEPLLERRGLK
ncbi:MAG: M3 family metallopeptidase [Candidatus Neomarinimicrobiota bacterium]|nr:M3 family metallopeptidase [Candidatus Neomarinimicrobiota bacterium]